MGQKRMAAALSFQFLTRSSFIDGVRNEWQTGTAQRRLQAHSLTNDRIINLCLHSKSCFVWVKCEPACTVQLNTQGVGCHRAQYGERVFNNFHAASLKLRQARQGYQGAVRKYVDVCFKIKACVGIRVYERPTFFLCLACSFFLSLLLMIHQSKAYGQLEWIIFYKKGDPCRW